MGPKTFKVAIVAIVGLLALSALPGVGAIIGLFFAFTIAFFVAPLAFGLQHAAGLAGLQPSFEQLLVAMSVAYYAAVAIGCFQAWRAFARSDLGRARVITAKAALFAALPLVGYLSVGALASAWR